MNMQIIDVSTPAPQSLVEITGQVREMLSRVQMSNGLIHLFTQHTTCGLYINENADPDLRIDLLERMEQLVPWERDGDLHNEGNTAAHLRSILVGTSVSIPVHARRLALGRWQGIFLAEFDGPRRRSVVLSTFAE